MTSRCLQVWVQPTNGVTPRQQVTPRPSVTAGKDRLHRHLSVPAAAFAVPADEWRTGGGLKTDGLFLEAR